MNEHHYIACDLGAESGRVILGTLREGRLSLEEIHRFSTSPIPLFGSLRWNLLGIFEELRTGLAKATALGLPIKGVSVDSWGVDYALLRENAPLLAPAHHYRDGRTDEPYARVMAEGNAACIFEESGIQFMNINTLYQLISEAERNPELLNAAQQFLNIGDYFNYLLCGVARAEESLASTTQLYNPRERDWSQPLIARFNLPAALFPKVVPSGTVLGPVREESAPGLAGASVVATCSHDTGCAVAAVPAQGDDWAYLSSGTWSLLGVELPSPLINDAVRAANFTNEAGYGGTTRFLKNTAGLWILQECRRAWEAQGQAFDYSQLTDLAAQAEPFRSLINPGDERFLKPGGMPERINAYCRETNQPIPETPGATVRAILESLALLYRENIEVLARLTGREINRLHIVGGGTRSGLLNQFAANATGLPVHAGPVEATAVGNVLIQALALGHLDSLAALRQTVRASFEPELFQPKDAAAWQAAYTRFLNLK